jgi:septum site-determining protein MinC
MDNYDQNLIHIKGVRDGLLMTLGRGEWPDLQNQLVNHISENEAFFKGAKVAIEVGNQTLRAAELGSLRNLLSDRDVTLWAVLSSSSITEKNAQALGLATRLSIPRAERIIKTQDTMIEGESAILVHRTLRSGYKITNNGHVIVIGDINPGAEIIAGGSIVVWGKIKGMVHAGADGNETALICALELSPMSLRIGELMAEPQLKKNFTHPERARIENNQILVEPWDNKGEA